MDAEDFVGAFVYFQQTINRYYLLAGKLMSETAAVGALFDSIIALDEGHPANAYAALPPEIVDLTFGRKLDRVQAIAPTILGADHESTLGLGEPARNVACLRNLVAHSNVTTGDSRDDTVTLQHSPWRAGYVRDVLPLKDLDEALEVTIDLVADALVVISHMPGSNLEPSTRADYE